MKAPEFCYWLQGYFELSGAVSLNEQQVQCVLAHLKMVDIQALA